jgi:hypothetical protein
MPAGLASPHIGKRLRTMLFLVFPCWFGMHSKKDVMMDENQQEPRLLRTAADPQVDLSIRIRAIDDLAKLGKASVAIELNKVLNRARPIPVSTKNWDDVGAERVVDQHVVKAMSLLGDDSQLSRLPLLIKAAGRVLTGPYDELKNAAGIVLGLGRVDLVRQLVMMAGDDAAQAVRNAVVVLDQMDLPLAPAGGSLSQVLRRDKKVAFEITTLKQELETISALSDGSVVLSDGVKSFLHSNDYERGLVKRVAVSLAEIIEKTVPLLDLDYYVSGRNVVICTHAEAGREWRAWWTRNATQLSYKKESGRFVLADHR